MKRMVLLAVAVVVATAVTSWAQSDKPKPYKVVFDLTSPDPMDQRAVLRWIKEVSTVNPKSEMEVVMYARGLDLVVNGKTTMAAEVAEAMKSAKFNVCAIAEGSIVMVVVATSAPFT